jgi:hypothetical protein
MPHTELVVVSFFINHSDRVIYLQHTDSNLAKIVFFQLLMLVLEHIINGCDWKGHKKKLPAHDLL